MKKNINLFIIIVLVILAVSLQISIKSVSNENADSGKNMPETIKLNDYYKLTYVPGMKILPFGSNILIYDKTKLSLISSKLDPKNQDIFSTNIQISDFFMVTKAEDIYLADLTNKIIYKFDKSGLTVSQKQLDKHIYDIHAFDKSRLIVHYNTDVGTEGLILLDEKLNTVKEITFPNTTITMIKEDPVNGNLLLSSLMKTDENIINKFYIYDKDLRLISTKEFPNIVCSKLIIGKNHIIVVDPDSVYVCDKSFENAKKADSEENFRNAVLLNDEEICLIDGEKKVRHLGINLEPKSEENYENEIIGIKTFKNEPVVFTKDLLNIGKRQIHSQIELKDVIKLDSSHLLCVFRNGIKVIGENSK